MSGTKGKSPAKADAEPTPEESKPASSKIEETHEDSDSDNDKQDDEEEVVNLGFVDKAEDPLYMQSNYFPSKVGGVPAWLNLAHLPTAEDLQCRSCKEQLSFLLQLYAPGPTDASFHRQLVVFICLNAKCSENNATSVRAFRCGLARDNEFYSPEPPVYEVDDEQIEASRALLEKYKLSVEPDSEVHRCKMPFAELELLTEAELTAEEREQLLLDDPDARKLLKQYAAKVKDGEDLKSSDLGELKNQSSVEDAVLTAFQTRVAVDPKQVIRYYYFPSAKPLWLHGKDHAKDVPDCPHCGSPRMVEVQILPQLIHYLKGGTGENQEKWYMEGCADNLDYGSIVVYSCQADCSAKEGADSQYIEEYIHIQGPVTE